MKIKTKLKDKPCVVFFAYETWNGCYCETYGSYEEAKKKSHDYGVDLVGYLKSYYYGCTERIDEIENLKSKPTIAQVKDFMKGCYKVLEA